MFKLCVRIRKYVPSFCFMLIFWEFRTAGIINFIINTVKLNIVHTMDIHNVILTINPRLLGIGSILLNVKIMYINVFMFTIYDIFLYS